MNDTQLFHKNNGYYIPVTQVPDSIGCIAHFPLNKFLSMSEMLKTYILNPTAYVIEVYIMDKLHTVQATSSNIRLLILQDIILTAYNRGMSKDLVMVEGTDKNLFQMLEFPQTKKEKDLETQLCVNFRELLDGNIVTSNIEGYEQVFLCFENGGLSL